MTISPEEGYDIGVAQLRERKKKCKSLYQTLILLQFPNLYHYIIIHSFKFYKTHLTKSPHKLHTDLTHHQN